MTDPLRPEPSAVAAAFEGVVDERWLAAREPDETLEDLVAAARRHLQSLPHDTQTEILSAHPRLGAEPFELIDHELSFVEQRAAEVTAEERAVLRELNAEYEAQFGFRFVAMVGDRSLIDMVPVLRAALNRSADEERRRGVDAVVDIAARRLHLATSS